MVVQDLYVFKLKFHSNFSLYKRQKHERKKSPKKRKKKTLFYATFQCGRYSVFKKNLTFFFDPEKVKKRASKVAHNQPNPFFSQSSPDHSPELIFNIMKSWDQTSVLLSVDMSVKATLFFM
jgi:hypothetical protein